MHIVKRILYRLCQGYQTIANYFCNERQDFVIIIFNMFIILETIQEVELILNTNHNSNSQSIFVKLNQFVITKYLDNDDTIKYFGILLILGNLLLILWLLCAHSKISFQAISFIFIQSQVQIILIPLLTKIFTHNQDALTYIILGINLIFVYFHKLMWHFNNRQTMLIDIEGFKASFTIIIYIMLILFQSLAVILKSYFSNGTLILLLFKSSFNLIQMINNFNKNSLFLLVTYQLSIITLIFLQFELDILYFFIISSIFIWTFLCLNQMAISQEILKDGLTFQKCQILSRIMQSTKSVQQNIQIILLKNQSQTKIQINNVDQVEQFLKQLLDNPNIQLKYKSFLSKIYANLIFQKYPLKTLILLKQFEDNTSYYDQTYIKVVSINLIQQITLKQQQNLLKEKSTENSAQISLKDFAQASKQSQITVQKMQVINKHKLQFYEQLKSTISKGITELTIDLSQISFELLEQLEFMSKIYDIKKLKLRSIQNQEILSLRILQIHYAIILQDINNAHLCENQIMEILKLDKQFGEGMINNQCLALNQTLILSTSLIHQKGQLQEYDAAQASRFFNCDLLQVQHIQFIHEFMPDFIAEIHDQLVDSFINNGYSRLMQKSAHGFLKDPNSYIVSCQQFLWYPQNNDNLRLYAFFIKDIDKEYILISPTGEILGMSQQFCKFIMNPDVQNHHFQSFQFAECFIQQFISISQQMEQLKKTIEEMENYDKTKAQQNQNKDIHQFSNYYSLTNLKSNWNLNHLNEDMQLQAELIRGNLKKLQYNSDDCIEDYYVPLLNAQINRLFERSKQNQVVEVSYQLTMQKITDKIFFVMQLQDYKIKSQATFSTNTLIDPKMDISSHFTANIEENNLTDYFDSEMSQIKQIQAINIQEHQQYIQHQFQELENDFELPLEIFNISQQKNLFNASQQKLLQSSRQTNRQLLSSRQVQNIVEMSKPQDINYDLNQDSAMMEEIEKEMNEIQNQENRLQQIYFDQGSVSLHKSSLQQISKERAKQTECTITINNQNYQEYDDVKKILNKSNNLVVLHYALYYKLLFFISIIVLVIFIIFEIKINVLQFQQDMVKVEPFQGLSYFIGSSTINLWNLYLANQSIINASQALLNGMRDKYITTITYAELQAQFQIYVCQNRNNDKYPELFGNFSICYETLIQSQAIQYYPFINYQKSKEIDFFNFNYNNSLIKQLGEYVIYFYYQTDQLNQYLKYQGISQITYILTTVFIFVCLMNLIYDIQLIRITDKIIQSFNFLLQRLSEEDLTELIVKHQLIDKTIINEQWRLTNYSYILKYEVVNDKPTLIKTKKKLEFNAKNKSSIRFIVLSYSFIKLLFLVIFSIGGLLYYLDLYYKYIPSVQLTYDFILLKEGLDTASILGNSIKTFPLADTQCDESYQRDLISNLQTLIQSIQNRFNSILTKIIDSTYLDNNIKEQIMQIFNEDLCTQTLLPLKYCNLNQLQINYYESDYYGSIVSQGVSGLLSSFSKFIIQEYDYELKNLKFSNDKENLKETINNPAFKNLFIQYQIDIESVLYQTFFLFKAADSTATNQFINNIYKFYLSIGITLLVIMILFETYFLIRTQTFFNRYKCLILLLPQHKLGNSIILQKIKEILKYFF